MAAPWFSKRLRFRRSVRTVLIVLMFGLIGMAGYLKEYNLIPEGYRLFIPIAVVMTLVAWLTFRYLQQGAGGGVEFDKDFATTRFFLGEIEELKSHTARQLQEQAVRQRALQEEILALRKFSGKFDVFDEITRSEAIAEFASRLEGLGIDGVVGRIEEKFGEKYSDALTLDIVLQGIQASRIRLEKEISAQQRRGSVNLVIGMVVTAIGILYLVYTVHVTTSSASAVSLQAFLMGFIPRISLAFFMQIFAFFFLRLYKLSLIEIKYFQNELTNIESKWVALSAAIHTKGKGAVDQMAGELIKTERNFVLEKNQKTIADEKQKNVTESLLHVLKAIAGKLNFESKSEAAG